MPTSSTTFQFIPFQLYNFMVSGILTWSIFLLPHLSMESLWYFKMGGSSTFTALHYFRENTLFFFF